MCIVGIADVVHLVLIWTKYLLVSRMHTRQQKRQSALCHSLHAVPSVSLTNIAMFKRTCNSARLLSFRWQINLFFNINRWLTLGYLKNKFFLFCFLFNKNLGMRQMTKHTKVLPPKVFFFFLSWLPRTLWVSPSRTPCARYRSARYRAFSYHVTRC